MRLSISRVARAGLLATGLVAFGQSASAATITFTTTGSSNIGSLDNTRSWTDAGSGLTLTTKAYTYGTDFNDALLGIYSFGLGVCETAGTCTNPYHQVDNSSGKDEWVLFSFSSPVSPTSVHVHSTDGSDTEAAWFWGSTALTDLTPGGDGSGTPDLTYASAILGSVTKSATSGTVSDRDVALGIFPNSAMWLLIGVDPARTYDKFKITSITVDTNPPLRDVPVPEPTSLLLLGTGLVALGNRMRRYLS